MSDITNIAKSLGETLLELQSRVEKLEQRPLMAAPETDPELIRIMREEFLTIPQVARLYQVTEKTVYNQIAGGHIPTHKLGDGAVRIRREDLIKRTERNLRAA